MKKFIKRALVFAMFLTVTRSFAQTEVNGWLFYFHNQKITPRLDFTGDIQLRSADRLAYNNVTLTRGALSYNLSKKHAVALGYAYVDDRVINDLKTTHAYENRIFQQYLFRTRHHRTEITGRARLEQRFIRKEGHTDFSQRARLFANVRIPIAANANFSKGLFTAVQNETMFNVHHKDRVNRHVFDQNRAYMSLGYRWSKKLDTELAYMHWYRKRLSGDFTHHVAVLMVTARI